MLCKWCNENDVQPDEKCGYCGTIHGEDKPRLMMEKPTGKLKVPLKGLTRKTMKKK